MHRLSNEIQRVRSIFKFGYEAGILDKPVRFGPGFKKPSAKVIRQNRAKAGLRMFEREELLALLEATPRFRRRWSCWLSTVGWATMTLPRYP